MSSLEVLAPGLLTTVQDFGRAAFGPMGISPSGAADPVALHLGNLLVGNQPSAPALEMTLAGGTFIFRGIPHTLAIALAGSDFAATLEGRPLETWRSYPVNPDETLTLRQSRSGARVYLCISGGIRVPSFLGSASTHLVSGLGGFEGRALRKHDLLYLSSPRAPFTERNLSSKVLQFLQSRPTLRVTPGPQADRFPVGLRQSFYASTFRVSEQSNRLGLRLDGLTLPSSLLSELITEGVSLGAIQVTPSGQPIILFVEQQTTGGYPKIANIIAADLFRVGQLRPRDTIRFSPVSFSEARDAHSELQNLLASEQSLFS